MKKAFYTVVVIIILLSVALAFMGKDSSPSAFTSYREASYEIDGKSVILGTEDVAYWGNEATGDLNGDGVKDKAFLITSEPGGSGTFYYVVAALKTDAGYVGTNAMLLGDRVAPQNTSIQEGDVIVNYAERRDDEPMTAQASHGITSYFKIADGKLVYQGSR